MILYPAIDLKGGACVRLERGEMASATLFNADPADQARRFAALGFTWLHVVDLDGAFEGRAINAPAVRAILDAASLPVQLGGGIRTRKDAEHWLDIGIERVILGTVAVRNPALVKELARAHPGRIAVGIDARGGRVAVEGWTEQTQIEAVDLAKRFEDAGVAAIIFTDIDRDGLLKGINVAATAALAGAVRLPVIASGGLAGIEDVMALLSADAKIAGAIAGRALYDGRLDAKAALSLLEAA